ncbi:MAG: hypothetical protein HOE19_04190 [Candidatus Komeilibacteria bacterium]|jgi:phosphopantothenoylcysteine decarboxylase / phosphopantothenate---cysteine ligase|nr:hypothetical protein [Candidatus Komeilibacteria bacterium]MBT4447874.1 hypothetical protein [Candidatus Komeilibacteria bacterium]
MNKILNKKKILITAGPVWVSIDKVRIMTNIFGGALGYEIAKQARSLGAEVVLLMGPGRVYFTGKEKFKVIKFKSFEDIHKLLKKEISSKKYDAVIHSAAIPDYIPNKSHKGKIKSGKNNFTIKFKPTFKIVDRIKKWDSKILLVKFKLEVGKFEKELIDIAYKALLQSRADFIVANEFSEVNNKRHIAYIINNNKDIIRCVSKTSIARKLLKNISNNI